MDYSYYGRVIKKRPKKCLHLFILSVYKSWTIKVFHKAETRLKDIKDAKIS